MRWLRSQIAALARRDPNRVALRRAGRAGIAVPLSIVVLESIPYCQQTALFGVFAVLALLIFSDFGGPRWQRLSAYLATVTVGIPIMIVGSLTGATIAGSMITMFVVAMILGMLAVLRGPIASAQTTLLLATVLSVTSTPPGATWPATVSWIVGGLLATAAAMLMWPAPSSESLVRRLAVIYRRCGTLVTQRWSEGCTAEQLSHSCSLLDDDIADLHGIYDGNLQRPAGVTSDDRALAELVELASRLRTYQVWNDLEGPKDFSVDTLNRINLDLAQATASQLQSIGAHLSGEAAVPDASVIVTARQRHLDAMAAWLQRHQREHPGSDLRTHIDDAFPLRATSVTTELAAVSATLATRSKPPEFDDPALPTGYLENRGWWVKLRSQTTLDSPWFRNALRAAIALSISVGIASWSGLDHSFWIVLGTLSALRFDALGTGRTVAKALLGTAIGVALAIGLILLLGPHDIYWAILLPFTIFIAAYTPGMFSLVTGQAGFSLAVLVLFSLIYPADVRNAEFRILDVAIGLTISFVVAFVLWPRGVVATLYRRMSEAMDAATDYLVASVDYLCGGAVDGALLKRFAQASNAAIDRAQEAYDLSVAQRPPKGVPLQLWSRVSNGTRHVDFAAHNYPTVSWVVRTRGDGRAVPPSLVGPLLDAANEVRDHLRETTRAWRESRYASDDPLTMAEIRTGSRPAISRSPHIESLRHAIDVFINAPSDWRGDGPDPRPALIAWITDWSALIDWNSIKLREDILAEGTDEASAGEPSAVSPG